MEISLHSMFWITGGLFAFAIVVGIIRRKQMQRAADLFADTEQQFQPNTAEETLTDDFVGQYGDQVISAARDVGQTNTAQTTTFDVVTSDAPVVVMYVMAEPGKEFCGYDLQQSLANVGMIYGESRIFHRHQEAGGMGPLLFSLASAVEPGIIDIDNIGVYSTPGLCLFLDCNDHPFAMQSFKLMAQTARQLAKELGGVALDGHHQPWNQHTETAICETIEVALEPA